jgi:hypothetical protein
LTFVTLPFTLHLHLRKNIIFFKIFQIKFFYDFLILGCDQHHSLREKEEEDDDQQKLKRQKSSGRYKRRRKQPQQQRFQLLDRLQ